MPKPDIDPYEAYKNEKKKKENGENYEIGLIKNNFGMFDSRVKVKHQ